MAREIRITIDVTISPLEQALDLLKRIDSHGPIGMEGNNPHKECPSCRRCFDRAVRLLEKEIKRSV